jgi:hypothetical protein
MRETTASNEIIKGVSAQGGGSTTATEIQAQIAGSGQRLALKVTQIEDEGFHQLATLVLRMIKLYVTEPMLVRVVGRDGVRWEEFNPLEFAGEYDVEVQLETTVNSQKALQANQAKEMYAAFLNDPTINQSALKKLVLQRGFDLDPDEVDELMAEPETMTPEMQLEMLPQQPEMMPEMLPEQLPPELSQMMPESMPMAPEMPQGVPMEMM